MFSAHAQCAWVCLIPYLVSCLSWVLENTVFQTEKVRLGKLPSCHRVHFPGGLFLEAASQATPWVGTVSVQPPWKGVTWEGSFHWACGSGRSVGGPESSELLVGWVRHLRSSLFLIPPAFFVVLAGFHLLHCCHMAPRLFSWRLGPLSGALTSGPDQPTFHLAHSRLASPGQLLALLSLSLFLVPEGLCTPASASGAPSAFREMC